MSKKIMALVLALAMVFSTITVAFAEEPVAEVGPEAAALAKIEVLKGVDGVTAEYLKEAPTRLQAAIMLLRLKGLEDVAKEFVSEDNFEDVKDYAWAEGKNIMAYLKANPGVGYRGTDKGFEPNKAITPKEFYKVLLVTLGYVENTADVSGDFTWDTVEDKIKEVGLGKVLDVEAFTNNDMAIATVEALKINVKESEKTLLATLIDNNKVDEEKAIAAGLMEAAPVVTAKLDSAVALGNTVVEVTFDAEINEGAEDVALYAIEGLDVKAAVLAGEKVVRLETAAMTAGKVYVITVGEEKVKFTGLGKVSGAPSIKTVVSEDVEEVVITFDKNIDFETGTDVANYTISGIEVVEAEVSGDEVTLTTVGLAARKQYTVKVTNVKSVDGGLLKAASKSFYTRPDTSAPTVKEVKAETNERVIILFNEKITKDSAENIENYTIKTGTTELAVLEAKLVTTGDNKNKEVELTTEVQKANARYEISIINIADRTKAGNAITKAVKKTFYGKKEDTTAPTYAGAAAISRNHIEVKFKDNSRFDEASVLDVNNYTLTKSSEDIAVNNAEKTSFKDGVFTVILTVDDLSVGSYSLKIADIADEFGNVMSEKKTTVSVKREDLAAATVKKYEVTDTDTIVVTFTKPLKEASAEDISNYKFNNDIGAPSAVTYDNDDRTVEIETVEFAQGKTYKLTIDGVEDIAGNVLDLNFKFVAVKGEVDNTAPQLSDVYAINKHVVALAFDEEVEYTTASITLENVKDSTTITLDAKTTSEDDTVIEFSDYSTAPGYTIKTLDPSAEYKIKNITGIIADLAGNKFVPLSDYKAFPVYGTDEKPEPIEVLNITQTNAKTFEITMSADVMKIAAGTPVSALAGGTSGSFTAKSDADDETLVYLEKTTVIKESDEYRIDLASFIKDKHGIPTENLDKDEYTVFYAEYEDDEKPYIVNVVATDRNTVEIEYSEEIDSAFPGTYTIKNADETVSKSSISYTSKVDSDDGKLVVLTLGTPLEGRYDYKLIIGSTAAKDLAGKTAEEAKGDEFFFNGTDLAPVMDVVADQKTVDAEAAKYVTSVTVPKTVADSAYADVMPELIANREVAVDASNNPVVTVKAVAKEGVTYNYLDPTKVQVQSDSTKPGYLTYLTEVLLQKQAASDATDNVEVVVLEFTKGDAKTTIEVTVTIEKQ